MFNEDEKQAMNTFEKAIINFEINFFGNGPFSESKITEALGLVRTSKLLEERRIKIMMRMNESGYGELAKSMDFNQQSSTQSLSRTKDDYANKFDKFGDIIIPIRNILTVLREKIPEDMRIKELLERSEKCIKELENISNIVRYFR